jgi:F-type H+-transporting ATPase subunit beta
MDDGLQLNVAFLKKRVPNLTVAARAAGLRSATVSNLCTGKIPIGGAEVRTLATLASIAGCTMDELIIRKSGSGMIETGIRVIDLFAPVVRGGVVGFVARPMVGQIVMLAELFRRTKQRGFATVFWLSGKESQGIEDVTSEVEITCSTIDEVYQYISNERGVRDVILGADRGLVISGEMLALQEKLQEAGTRPITIALIDTRGESVDEDSPYGPLDTLWQFDVELASRSLYPAVSPLLSTSTILEGAQLEATHLAIQQRARKLLRRYRELRALVNAFGIEKLPESDVVIYKQGEQLEAYFAQPFYVAEPFRPELGEWTSLQDNLKHVVEIMDGGER